MLTPHPGEFDRLAGRKHTDFSERVAAARAFAQEHRVHVLLKGAPTISFDPDGLGVLNPTGNPGLATAGSGDVLTGIVAALRAQGLDAHSASWMAAYLHGRAADLAVEEVGMASLVAGDVIAYLPAAFASVAEEAEQGGEAEHNCRLQRTPRMSEPVADETPRLLPAAFWPAAAALWTAAVLALALSPDVRSSWLVKTLGDKILHCGAFTVGGIIWIKALETSPKLTRAGAWIAGTVAALLVGIAIELLQRYVPTRSADARDFLADILGVLVAVIYLTLALGVSTLRRRERV